MIGLTIGSGNGLETKDGDGGWVGSGGAVKSRQISMNRVAEVSAVQWSFGVFLVDMVASW